jgi:hypothetical protein
MAQRKPISNHPKIDSVEGQPVKRYVLYEGHGHNEKQKIIQIIVSRIHVIELNGAEISLPQIAPDDQVVLEANMNRYVDGNGTRVQLIPATYDENNVELTPAHYPLNSIPEYMYWYYAFTLPQILWDVLDANIQDQANKGAFDTYEL